MERVVGERRVNPRLGWARTSLAAVVCVISGIAVSAMAVISPHAGAVAAPTPKWVTQKTVLPVPTELTAISCPSASECVAVGASANNTEAILRSTDGGTTWSNASVPSVFGTETAVSCPSVTVCVANGLVSTDGGATWTSTTSTSTAFYGTTRLSCGAVDACVAVGVTGPYDTPALGYSKDDGATWTLGSVPAGLDAFQDVSCSSALDCMAAGANGQGLGLILVTSDGGVTWSLTPESTPQYIASLSCTSASNCVAAEIATGTQVVMIATTDAWAHWTTVTIPSNVVTVSGISCASTSDCTAIAGASDASQLYLETTDGGLSWIQAPSPTEPTWVAGISCVAASCAAIGSIGNSGGAYPLVLLRRPTLNGAWVEAAQPAGVIGIDGYIGFNGVSCVDARTCVVVGGSLFESTKDGGSTWSPTPTPDGQQTLQGVSCADASHCVAVGGTTRISLGSPKAALAYFTTDGTTWQTASLPGGIQLLQHVTCSSTSVCVAVGTTPSGGGVVIASIDSGATWTSRSLPNGIGELYASACTSTADCLVGGGVADPQSTLPVGYVLKTVDSGATWSSVTLPTGTGIVTAISCGTTSKCVGLVYGQVNAATYPAETALVSTNGGSTWSSGVMPSGIGDLVDASCVGNVCSAVGDSVTSVGVIVGSSDGGQTWQAQAAGYQYIRGVSCTAPATCEAVGEGNTGASVILGATPTAAVPGAPTIGTATAGNAQADVAFSPPASDGGSPITGYTATATDLTTPANGGQFTSGAASPLTVSGLTNGDHYTFTVDATNGTGTGSASAASNTVTPTAVPGAPTIGTATAGDGAATVQWSPPASDGGSPITGYTVTVSPGGATVAAGASATSVIVPGLTNGTSYRFTVTATNGAGTGPASASSNSVTPASSTPPVTTGTLTSSVVGIASLPSGLGYWLVSAHGEISPHGDAVSYGSLAGTPLNAPITHIVATPDGKGYWLVAGDGGTFSFGDAGFYGSTGGQHLNAPVVDIAPTQSGKGYWLVASDGGIFAFGDAQFDGSMGGQHLNQPVVGISPDFATGGYWLLASDGGIFAFGGAQFHGSEGGTHLNKPVEGMTGTADGKGYWFVASDGGIFAFGDAGFFGSAGSITLVASVVGMATNNATGGYWLVASDGGIFSYGTPFYGAH